MARKPYRVGVPAETQEPVPEIIPDQSQVMIMEYNPEGVVPKKNENPPIYKVKVNHPSLRRRAAPSTDARVLGLITDQGIYDIYEATQGWGRLEDHSWIMLQFCSKI